MAFRTWEKVGNEAITERANRASAVSYEVLKWWTILAVGLLMVGQFVLMSSVYQQGSQAFIGHLKVAYLFVILVFVNLIGVYAGSEAVVYWGADR
jgi:hypothetical protein